MLFLLLQIYSTFPHANHQHIMDICRVILTVSLIAKAWSVNPFERGGPSDTNNIPDLPRDPISTIGHGYPFMPHIPDLNKYIPRKKDLKLKKLLRKLGEDFDADWMSIETPVGLSVDHVTLSNDASVDLKLVREFNHLNLTFTNQQGLAVDVSSENLELFKRWLLHHGSCSVTFQWEDLGTLFWPRWVKLGSCVNEYSCSWPPGMHCVPMESKLIHVLRWNCNKHRKHRKHHRKHARMNHVHNINEKHKRRRKGRRMGLRCRWTKVEFPVTDICFCSC